MESTYRSLLETYENGDTYRGNVVVRTVAVAPTNTSGGSSPRGVRHNDDDVHHDFPLSSKGDHHQDWHHHPRGVHSHLDQGNHMSENDVSANTDGLLQRRELTLAPCEVADTPRTPLAPPPPTIKKQGFGAYTFTSKRTVYEGEWFDGERHGWGVYHRLPLPTRSESESRWKKNDQKNSSSVDVLTSSDRMTGTTTVISNNDDHVMEIEKVMETVHPDSVDEFEGYWVDGKPAFGTQVYYRPPADPARSCAQKHAIDDNHHHHHHHRHGHRHGHPHKHGARSNHASSSKHGEVHRLSGSDTEDEQPPIALSDVFHGRLNCDGEKDGPALLLTAVREADQHAALNEQHATIEDGAQDGGRQQNEAEERQATVGDSTNDRSASSVVWTYEVSSALFDRDTLVSYTPLFQLPSDVVVAAFETSCHAGVDNIVDRGGRPTGLLSSMARESFAQRQRQRQSPSVSPVRGLKMKRAHSDREHDSEISGTGFGVQSSPDRMSPSREVSRTPPRPLKGRRSDQVATVSATAGRGAVRVRATNATLSSESGHTQSPSSSGTSSRRLATSSSRGGSQERLTVLESEESLLAQSLLWATVSSVFYADAPSSRGHKSSGLNHLDGHVRANEGKAVEVMSRSGSQARTNDAVTPVIPISRKTTCRPTLPASVLIAYVRRRVRSSLLRMIESSADAATTVVEWERELKAGEGQPSNSVSGQDEHMPAPGCGNVSARAVAGECHTLTQSPAMLQRRAERMLELFAAPLCRVPAELEQLLRDEESSVLMELLDSREPTNEDSENAPSASVLDAVKPTHSRKCFTSLEPYPKGEVTPNVPRQSPFVSHFGKVLGVVSADLVDSLAISQESLVLQQHQHQQQADQQNKTHDHRQARDRGREPEQKQRQQQHSTHQRSSDKRSDSKTTTGSKDARSRSTSAVSTSSTVHSSSRPVKKQVAQGRPTRKQDAHVVVARAGEKNEASINRSSSAVSTSSSVHSSRLRASASSSTRRATVALEMNAHGRHPSRQAEEATTPRAEGGVDASRHAAARDPTTSRSQVTSAHGQTRTHKETKELPRHDDAHAIEDRHIGSSVDEDPEIEALRHVTSLAMSQLSVSNASDTDVDGGLHNHGLGNSGAGSLPSDEGLATPMMSSTAAVSPLSDNSTTHAIELVTAAIRALRQREREQEQQEHQQQRMMQQQQQTHEQQPSQQEVLLRALSAAVASTLSSSSNRDRSSRPAGGRSDRSANRGVDLSHRDRDREEFDHNTHLPLRNTPSPLQLPNVSFSAFSGISAVSSTKSGPGSSSVTPALEQSPDAPRAVSVSSPDTPASHPITPQPNQEARISDARASSRQAEQVMHAPRPVKRAVPVSSPRASGDDGGKDNAAMMSDTTPEASTTTLTPPPTAGIDDVNVSTGGDLRPEDCFFSTNPQLGDNAEGAERLGDEMKQRAVGDHRDSTGTVLSSVGGGSVVSRGVSSSTARSAWSTRHDDKRPAPLPKSPLFAMSPSSLVSNDRERGPASGPSNPYGSGAGESAGAGSTTQTPTQLSPGRGWAQGISSHPMAGGGGGHGGGSAWSSGPPSPSIDAMAGGYDAGAYLSQPSLASSRRGSSVALNRFYDSDGSYRSAQERQDLGNKLDSLLHELVSIASNSFSRENSRQRGVSVGFESTVGGGSFFSTGTGGGTEGGSRSTSLAVSDDDDDPEIGRTKEPSADQPRPEKTKGHSTDVRKQHHHGHGHGHGRKKHAPPPAAVVSLPDHPHFYQQAMREAERARQAEAQQAEELAQHDADQPLEIVPDHTEAGAAAKVNLENTDETTPPIEDGSQRQGDMKENESPGKALRHPTTLQRIRRTHRDPHSLRSDQLPPPVGVRTPPPPPPQQPHTASHSSGAVIEETVMEGEHTHHHQQHQHQHAPVIMPSSMALPIGEASASPTKRTHHDLRSLNPSSHHVPALQDDPLRDGDVEHDDHNAVQRENQNSHGGRGYRQVGQGGSDLLSLQEKLRRASSQSSSAASSKVMPRSSSHYTVSRDSDSDSLASTSPSASRSSRGDSLRDTPAPTKEIQDTQRTSGHTIPNKATDVGRSPERVQRRRGNRDIALGAASSSTSGYEEQDDSTGFAQPRHATLTSGVHHHFPLRDAQNAADVDNDDAGTVSSLSAPEDLQDATQSNSGDRPSNDSSGHRHDTTREGAAASGARDQPAGRSMLTRSALEGMLEEMKNAASNSHETAADRSVDGDARGGGDEGGAHDDQADGDVSSLSSLSHIHSDSDVLSSKRSSLCPSNDAGGIDDGTRKVSDTDDDQGNREGALVSGLKRSSDVRDAGRAHASHRSHTSDQTNPSAQPSLHSSPNDGGSYPHRRGELYHHHHEQHDGHHHGHHRSQLQRHNSRGLDQREEEGILQPSRSSSKSPVSDGLSDVPEPQQSVSQIESPRSDVNRNDCLAGASASASDASSAPSSQKRLHEGRRGMSGSKSTTMPAHPKQWVTPQEAHRAELRQREIEKHLQSRREAKEKLLMRKEAKIERLEQVAADTRARHELAHRAAEKATLSRGGSGANGQHGPSSSRHVQGSINEDTEARADERSRHRRLQRGGTSSSSSAVTSHSGVTSTSTLTDRGAFASLGIDDDDAEEVDVIRNTNNDRHVTPTERPRSVKPNDAAVVYNDHGHHSWSLHDEDGAEARRRRRDSDGLEGLVQTPRLQRRSDDSISDISPGISSRHDQNDPPHHAGAHHDSNGHDDTGGGAFAFAFDRTVSDAADTANRFDHTVSDAPTPGYVPRAVPGPMVHQTWTPQDERSDRTAATTRSNGGVARPKNNDAIDRLMATRDSMGANANQTHKRTRNGQAQSAHERERWGREGERSVSEQSCGSVDDDTAPSLTPSFGLSGESREALARRQDSNGQHQFNQPSYRSSTHSQRVPQTTRQRDSVRVHNGAVSVAKQRPGSAARGSSLRTTVSAGASVSVDSPSRLGRRSREAAPTAPIRESNDHAQRGALVLAQPTTASRGNAALVVKEQQQHHARNHKQQQQEQSPSPRRGAALRGTKTSGRPVFPPAHTLSVADDRIVTPTRAALLQSAHERSSSREATPAEYDVALAVLRRKREGSAPRSVEGSP